MPEETDRVAVVYRGRDHTKTDRRPYRVTGFPFAFPIDEPVEITADFVRAHFRREHFRDFIEFLFGEHGTYNANRAQRWFEILDPAPVVTKDPAPSADPVQAEQPAPVSLTPADATPTPGFTGLVTG